MMARTDGPGTVTHLQIPVLADCTVTPSSRIDITPEAVAFYHYKVLELRSAMEGVMREIDSRRGNVHDLDMLIFLECIDRKVSPGQEVSLVMNSLKHDAEDRVCKWLAKHPRFTVSAFADDRVWLDIITGIANRIPDECKRMETFRLEHFLATIAERGSERARPVICYMQG